MDSMVVERREVGNKERLLSPLTGESQEHEQGTYTRAIARLNAMDRPNLECMGWFQMVLEVRFSSNCSLTEL